jgi:hypothetical protein
VPNLHDALHNADQHREVFLHPPCILDLLCQAGQDCSSVSKLLNCITVFSIKLTSLQSFNILKQDRTGDQQYAGQEGGEQVAATW